MYVHSKIIIFKDNVVIFLIKKVSETFTVFLCLFWIVLGRSRRTLFLSNSTGWDWWERSMPSTVSSWKESSWVCIIFIQSSTLTKSQLPNGLLLKFKSKEPYKVTFISCQMRLTNFAYFLLRVLFLYYFLDHFSIELNEICSPSLLNSILKKVQRDISLNIMIFLSNKISFVSPQKLIKNVLFNKTKNT